MGDCEGLEVVGLWVGSMEGLVVNGGIDGGENDVGGVLIDGLAVGLLVRKHQAGPLVDSYKLFRKSYSEWTSGTGAPLQSLP